MALSERQTPAVFGGRDENCACFVIDALSNSASFLQRQSASGCEAICLRRRRERWLKARFPVSPELARYLAEMAFSEARHG